MKVIQMFVWAGLFVLLPFISLAQQGSGGWCANNNYSRIFNATTISELNGSVVSIEKVTHETGMSKGVILMINADKNENIPVHLGPEWYLDNQDIQFVVGDIITVKGSRITYQNTPTIIAMTIQKGAQILVLRDKKGNRSWNGWQQGNGRNGGNRNGGRGNRMRN